MLKDNITVVGTRLVAKQLKQDRQIFVWLFIRGRWGVQAALVVLVVIPQIITARLHHIQLIQHFLSSFVRILLAGVPGFRFQNRLCECEIERVQEVFNYVESQSTLVCFQGICLFLCLVFFRRFFFLAVQRVDQFVSGTRNLRLRISIFQNVVDVGAKLGLKLIKVLSLNNVTFLREEVWNLWHALSQFCKKEY